MADIVLKKLGKLDKDIETTVRESGNCYIKFISGLTLNSIDEINLKANVTIIFSLKVQYYHWDSTWGFTYSILVNGETKASKTTSSGGTGSYINSEGKEVAYKGPQTTLLTSWTGDIPYNSDGTLTAKIGFKSDNLKTASFTPPNKTVTYSIEFPIITIANAYVKNENIMKLAEAHILRNGQFVPCAVYQKQGNGFIEINLNKANLAE